MTALQPNETELIGRWIETEGKVFDDVVSERITSLTSGVLELIQDHPESYGWIRLYRDRADGRYWERSYPHGELHGGGPPALRWISDEEAVRVYFLRP